MPLDIKNQTFFSSFSPFLLSSFSFSPSFSHCFVPSSFPFPPALLIIYIVGTFIPTLQIKESRQGEVKQLAYYLLGQVEITEELLAYIEPLGSL